MVLVHAAESLAVVTNVRNALEANGIPCVIRNDILTAGLGELPPIECWPEVWVVDDGDAERAKELIAEATAESDGADVPWRCGRCGEDVDAGFDECWNCGTERSA